MTEAINRPSGMPDPVVAPMNEDMWRAAADGRVNDGARSPVERTGISPDRRVLPLQLPRLGVVHAAGTGTVHVHLDPRSGPHH